jgi:hypothetical protein
MTLLRRCLFIAALGLVIPVTNCTLITDVDRSLIDEGTGGANDGAGGTGADAPTSNGDVGTDAVLDDADLP